MKKIFLTIVVILFISSPLYAQNSMDDFMNKETEKENVIEELYDVQINYRIKDGKPICLNFSGADINAENVIDLENVVVKNDELDGYYWQVNEGGNIAFTVPSRKAKKIEATLSYSFEGKGTVKIRWNGKDQELVKFDENAVGTLTKTLTFTSQAGSNSLKIIATEGAIKIIELKVEYQEPYPVFEDENKTVKFILKSPSPNAELSESPDIQFEWIVSGNYKNLWIELQYRGKNNYTWTIVPGAKGLVLDQDKGTYKWKDWSKIDGIEFNVKIHSDKNPTEQQKEEEIIRQKNLNELMKIKWWNYLSQTKQHIDNSLWRKYANKNYTGALLLNGRLEDVFNDGDKNKNIKNPDETKQDMDKLEILYFDAVTDIITGLLNEKDITPKKLDSVKEDTQKIFDLWTVTKDKADRNLEEQNDNAGIIKEVYASLFSSDSIDKLKNVIKDIEQKLDAVSPDSFKLVGTWKYDDNTLAIADDRLTLYVNASNDSDAPVKYKTYYYTYNLQTGNIAATDKDGKKMNANVQWINKDKFNWTSQNGTKTYSRFKKENNSSVTLPAN
ncbi:MAG: hypothetical protein LBC74_11930 [Planctomycetaceae bacterium]|jgi:hypothetical protein|nr:hypothetical protein [Planctomycetaceae bacterium]